MVMGRSIHHALDRDPILRAISSFYGITTTDGNPGGTTLVCAALAGSNDFITNKAILIESGLAIFEDAGAIAFDPANGEITVSPAFSSPVLAGTSFYVLNAASAGLLAPVVPLIIMNQGLCYYGVVTGVPVAGQFEIAALAGLGAAKFATVVPEYMYHAFVLRDAAGGGAAPQGESQPVSNYATNTGNFTANAFTVPVGIGDEILIIHPFLARIMNFAGLPPHVGSVAENWNTAEADIVQIGVADTSYKVHSLVLDITGLVGTVTIRMYQEVVGVERRVYEQTFTVAANGPGLWIVNGTVGIHEILRVTAQSDNAADNAQPIGYDYMLEAM